MIKPANPIAVSVASSTVYRFPFGSIIVMETYRVMEDENGEPVLDSNGRFIATADEPTIFVQRKESGFGVDYGVIRNGSWEYVAYHPDGSYATRPSGTGSCAACHLQGASATTAPPGGVLISANTTNIGAQWDYVFRPELFATPRFGGGSGAVPSAILHIRPERSGGTPTGQAYDPAAVRRPAPASTAEHSSRTIFPASSARRLRPLSHATVGSIPESYRPQIESSKFKSRCHVGAVASVLAGERCE